MGIRKTIYVADERVWAKISDRAAEKGVSISQLLLNSDIQLDRIEGKIDKLLGSNSKPAVKKGQAELDKGRKGRDIKKDKIKSVRDAVDVVGVPFFNPRPKK